MLAYSGAKQIQNGPAAATSFDELLRRVTSTSLIRDQAHLSFTKHYCI